MPNEAVLHMLNDLSHPDLASDEPSRACDFSDYELVIALNVVPLYPGRVELWLSLGIAEMAR